MASASNRNLGIDLAKALSCFAVVGLHLCGRDVSMANGVMYFLCGFAVPVFFMANGYFLLNKDRLDYAYVLGKVRSVLIIVVVWNVAVGLARLVIGKRFNPLADIAGSLLQQGVLWQFWFFGALILVQLLAPVIWRAMRSSRGGCFSSWLWALPALRWMS